MVIGNPCLIRMLSVAYSESKRQMTLRGIMIKSFILLVITVGFAVFTELVSNELIFTQWMNEGLLFGIDYIVLFIVSTFGAAFFFLAGIWIIGLDIVFMPVFSAFLGLMIGFFSMIFHEVYSLIVFSVLFSAVATVFAAMILYAYESFRLLNGIKRVVFSALSGLVVGQVLFLLLTLSFPDGLTFFSGKYWLQLLLSLLSVAACSLSVTDTLVGLYDAIDQALPKSFEWLGATSIVFCLLLMHIEFLRLFSFVGKRFDE